MTQSVPWNASWTGEHLYEIRPCRYTHGERAVWQNHAPGTGQPIFAKPHMVRQRRSIAEMICTVCGHRMPEGDRWWFRLGTIYEDEQLYRTTEAPVHLDCARHSQNVCPRLRGLGVEPSPFPRRFRVEAALIKAESLLTLYGIDSKVPVIGALKLVFPLKMFDVVDLVRQP